MYESKGLVKRLIVSCTVINVEIIVNKIAMTPTALALLSF